MDVTDIILIFSSFLTAAITGVLGMSGGLVLLSIMTVVLPPQLVIPLHGIIIFGNNFQRAALHHKEVQWQWVPAALFGGVVGVLLATFLIKEIPESLFKILLACGILTLAWLPKSKLDFSLPYKWWVMSLLSGFISMLIGGGTILLHSLLSRYTLTRQQFVATTGAFASVQHGPKVIAFALLLGFPFLQYLHLIVLMLIAGFVGNHAGKYLLDRVPEKLFKWLIRALITILAVRLLAEVVLG